MPKTLGKPIKGEKVGYRICVYWEESGTTAEGSMNGERTVVVTKRPTKDDMLFIEDRLKRTLEELLLRKARRSR